MATLTIIITMKSDGCGITAPHVLNLFVEGSNMQIFFDIFMDLVEQAKCSVQLAVLFEGLLGFCIGKRALWSTMLYKPVNP